MIWLVALTCGEATSAFERGWCLVRTLLAINPLRHRAFGHTYCGLFCVWV